MKQISIAILLCLCTLAGFAQGGQPLDLKDIVSGKFRAENIYGVIPIPGDGEHYSQMNAEGTQIIKYSFKTGKQVEVLFDGISHINLFHNRCHIPFFYFEIHVAGIQT